jgi:hypothetical protein
MNKELNIALNAYVFDPENPELNWNLAIIYDRMDQTAAAISFYLRCAERTEDKNLSYECLLRIGICFNRQGKRGNSERGAYLLAMHQMPTRPEAYFLTARYYERIGEHPLAYNFAELGLQFADFNQKPLRTWVEYSGKYTLIFEKMVSSWWWGKPQECRDLLRTLKNDYGMKMDPTHIAATQNNLSSLGCGPTTQAFVPYWGGYYPRLRHKFPGAETIARNYSQVMQDMFILSILDGKRNGTYLEIGSGDAEHGNNTKLLEEWGWTGIGIEYNQDLANTHTNKGRKNPVLCEDAFKQDYVALCGKIAVNGVVDYLQLDCEPSKATYDLLTMMPFEQFKFAVITFEHDHYVDITGIYRELSRQFLKSKGYVMVVNDISADGVSTFEDWWVHPELIDPAIFTKMRHRDSNPHHIVDYLIPELD